MLRYLVKKSLPLSIIIQLLVIAVAYGQPEQTTKNATPTDRTQEIQKKIEDLQHRIKLAADAETPESATALGVNLEQLKERSETLLEIQAYYNRQLIVLNKQQELNQDLAALENKIQSGEIYQLDKTPPYSLQFYDDYTLKISDSLKNKQSAELAQTIAQKSLDSAGERLKEAGQRLRSLKETMTANKETARTVLDWEINKAERELELAQVTRDYHEIALQNARKRMELADKRLVINQKNLAQIREHLTFDKSDLEKQLTSIDDRKNELLNESNDLIKKLQKQEVLSLRTQKKAEKAVTEEEKEAVKTASTAIDAWRLYYQKKLEQNENLQLLFNLQKQIWKWRYDLINENYDKKDLNQWKKEALSHSDKIQKNINLEQNYQTSIQLQLAAVEEKLSQATLSPEMLFNLQEHHNALKKTAEISFAYLTSISALQQMSNRFVDEIDMVHSQMTFWDHLSFFTTKIPAVWHFELMVIDDKGITVGKIIIALCFLIIGLFLIGRLTKLFLRRIFKKTRMSPSSAAITEKLIYYTLFLFVLLWAMNIVNIPLTAFTFLGGAVAIGVGFGAQKLFNNFISGFILMAEQPIKVGDLIQLDNELGWIDDIGVRSTKVRTFSNTNILVPNSYFLENNITNWTHTDNIVRCQVTVGVVYGSTVDKVKEQLLKAADQHKEILKNPVPYVFFSDFGDNALIFNLFFWISITAMTGRQRIESETRFIIEKLFREAGLIIAFPQRDVHIDTSRPLQIEVTKHEHPLPPGKPAGSEPAGP